MNSFLMTTIFDDWSLYYFILVEIIKDIRAWSHVPELVLLIIIGLLTAIYVYNDGGFKYWAYLLCIVPLVILILL